MSVSVGVQSFRSKVDLRSALSRWWIIVCSAMAGAAMAALACLVQTPIYASTATLYVTAGTNSDAQSAYQGSLASQQRVASYEKLVRSDLVLEAALRESKLGLSIDDARSRVTADATPDTVLLVLTARSPDPVESAVLVNAVASAMTTNVRRLETPADGSQALAKMTVVSPGVVSAVPVSPRYVRSCLLGFLIGVVLGFGSVLVWNRFDDRVKSGADFSGERGEILLSSVPNDARLSAGVPGFEMGSAAGEAFRRLRTNLEYSNVDSPIGSLLVTSSVESEGKTTVALNLALALAEDGRRVIVVDADLRRPSVAEQLNISGSIGLTDYLRGSSALIDVIQQSGVKGLDVLACGPIPPNPAELLGSDRASAGWLELESMYDFVVVDSPPLLAVTDAAVIAPRVDGVLLVARANRTSRHQLSTLLTELGKVGVSPSGFVLNGVSSGSGSYGYGYYAAQAETV